MKSKLKIEITYLRLSTDIRQNESDEEHDIDEINIKHWPRRRVNTAQTVKNANIVNNNTEDNSYEVKENINTDNTQD